MSSLCLLVAAGAVAGFFLLAVAPPGGLVVGSVQRTHTESHIVRFGPSEGLRVTREVRKSPAVTKQPLVLDAAAEGTGPRSRAGKVAAAIALAIPLAALAWGLWFGSRMFARLRRGEYFTRPTVRALRNFAFGLFIYKALPILTVPFAQLVDLLASPGFGETRRSAHMTLDPMKMDGALTLIFLGMILVFAHIMTKAAEIAEDNAQIV